MSKIKSRFITILSAIAALFLILGIVFALPARYSASAATYKPSNVFSAGTGGEVGASEAGEEEGAVSYVQFTIKDGGKVHFRRDLALKWYQVVPEDKPEDGGDENEGEGGETAQAKTNERLTPDYFSTEFSFPTVDFKTFKLSFESAEENISKDGLATNSLVFTKAEEGKVRVQVQAAGAEEPEGSVVVDDTASMKFFIDEEKADEPCAPGEFNVKLILNGDEANVISVGKFENIGGYYLEYRSSASSTPSIPMTFTAEFAEDAEEGATQKVLMKSLNGQTFELENGNVVDNAYPVLVLNEEIHAFTLGQRFSLTYEAIDVCDDSVTVTRNYYMAKYEEGAYKAPSERAADASSSDGADDYSQLTTSTYFLPVDDSVKGETDEEIEYVAIRFTLDDGTMPKIYSYLSWYAADNAVAQHDGYDFIKVDRDKKGPNYIGIGTEGEGASDADGNYVSPEAKKAAEDYQAALDLVAKNTSAGTGAYIYLPSLRGLISSAYADYRNLKFSIYYYRQSQTEGSGASSQTSLNYNALKLEVSEAGLYKFRVLATDAAGNNITLNLENKPVSVSSSNIWDIEAIPEFTFTIKYTGATIEKPKEQDLGYRNDTYTFDNFEIIALSGYTTDYTLYRFNREKLGDREEPTYSSFVENADKYVEEFKDCLDVIHVYQNDVKESDAKWKDTDNDYHWDPDSNLSFIPQEAGFYVLQVNVTDAQLAGVIKTAYQVIEVRNPIDTIPGESDWLKNNVLSVVLFSIAAVLAVIVVILFLIKPTDKGVEEIDLEKLKGKKKKSRNKK